MQLYAQEKPLGKWYFRFESGGILFPTYFETYYITEGITPMDFVWDSELGAVEIQQHQDRFYVYETEHQCIDVFLREQWDRGHFMQHWDLTLKRHRDLFNIFMEKYAHLIMAEPQGDANQIYIEMEKELLKYKEEK